MRRVQQKFRQVEESDYFTLLELPPDASSADIQRSHQALRAEFLPTALPYRCRSSMDRELRQIARALDEARSVLSNEATRRTYLAKLLPTAGSP
jgi:curved DNA-binding protein CbpA